LAIYGPVSPHFESHNGEIWRKGASPTPNFVKKSLKGIDPLGADLYQKILQVDDFGGLQPTYMISR